MPICHVNASVAVAPVAEVNLAAGMFDWILQAVPFFPKDFSRALPNFIPSLVPGRKGMLTGKKRCLLSMAATRKATALTAAILAAVLIFVGIGQAGLAGETGPLLAAGKDLPLAGTHNASLNETDLLESLFELDIKLARAREELERLAAEKEKLAEQIRLAESNRERASRELEGKQEAVSEWLCYLYENGSVSFLEVLLQARDFGEFAVQWELFGLLTDRQAEFLDEVRTVLNTAQSQRELLERLRSSLQQEEAKAILVEKSLADALAEKEELFAKARSLSPETGAALAVSGTRWSEAVQQLARLFGRFQSIAWNEIVPVDLQINYLAGRIEMAVPASELERVMRKVDPLTGNLRVRINPGELVILLPTAGADSQREGLEVAGEVRVVGGEAVFVPQRLVFGGVRLSERVVSLLVSGYDLKINAVSPIPGLRPVRATPAAGKLVLVLEI